MAEQVTKYERLRSLPFLYTSTFFNITFVLLSFWGPVPTLFLRECGLSISQIGVITAIIPAIGILAIFTSGYISKIGAKRLAIAGYFLRALSVALLIPIPFWIRELSTPNILILVFFSVLLFSLFRMLSEASFSEWAAELIPNERRGRTDAINTIVVSTAATLVNAFIALLGKREIGITLFGYLFIIALVAGIIASLTLIKLPCGKPNPFIVKQDNNFFFNILSTAKDSNFIFFLIANNIWFFFWGGLTTFLPLFLKEQLSFSQSDIFFLEMLMRFVSIFACILWGWCADRFGSKPVMMTGLYGFALTPFPFLFYSYFPQTIISYVIAITYIIIGIVLYAFILGANRYFYVQATPNDKRRVYYVTVNFTIQSGLLAISPLISGLIIDYFRSLDKKIYSLQFCPYTPFFILMIFVIIIAIIAGRRLTPDSHIGTGHFLSMFVEGNPFLALGNIMRFQSLISEDDRITATKHLGDSRTRLGVSDLLMALNDPSFNVRYEAVLALSHIPFDKQVMEALKKVLYSEEPDLSELAGWALGRQGDKRAIEPLRYMLKNANYALLKARCARSLANLEDIDSTGEILKLFREEKHISIKVAYAAALGKLKVVEAFDEVESLLRELKDTTLQGEVALAIARMIGVEKHFVRLWRLLSVEDISVGLVEYILELTHKYEDSKIITEIRQLLDNSSNLFAQSEYLKATILLVEAAEQIIKRYNIENELIRKTVERCILTLKDTKELRKDYLILLIISLQHIAVYEIRKIKEKNLN